MHFTISDLITALCILTEEDSVGLQDNEEVKTAIITIEHAIINAGIPEDRVLYVDHTKPPCPGCDLKAWTVTI
jgi:hypothetical protein